MPITDTVRAILTAAADHPDRRIRFPDRLPIAARRAVALSMLKAELIEEVEAEGEQLWRATDSGLAAVGNTSLNNAGGVLAPNKEVAELDLAGVREPLHGGLRGIALAFLVAWDTNPTQDRPALAAIIEALRGKLTPKPRTSTPRQPRPDTKRAAVLALLRRPGGATVAQVAEATGWATHTVRGFFAGLKKAGIPVEVMDRVKQVGAEQGVKGSYSVYRVAA